MFLFCCSLFNEQVAISGDFCPRFFQNEEKSHLALFYFFARGVIKFCNGINIFEYFKTCSPSVLDSGEQESIRKMATDVSLFPVITRTQICSSIISSKLFRWNFGRRCRLLITWTYQIFDQIGSPHSGLLSSKWIKLMQLIGCIVISVQIVFLLCSCSNLDSSTQN